MKTYLTTAFGILLFLAGLTGLFIAGVKYASRKDYAPIRINMDGVTMVRGSAIRVLTTDRELFVTLELKDDARTANSNSLLGNIVFDGTWPGTAAREGDTP